MSKATEYKQNKQEVSHTMILPTYGECYLNKGVVHFCVFVHLRFLLQHM